MILRQYLKQLSKKLSVGKVTMGQSRRATHDYKLPVSNYHTDRAYLDVYIDANILENQQEHHQIDPKKCINCNACIKQCQVNAIS